MEWQTEIAQIIGWALRYQDLRHQYIYSKDASELKHAPGIADALEVTIILAIFEAAIGKGFVEGSTVGYEVPYPNSTHNNPRRADLAFKDEGQGKNWRYVEVKSYGNNGKAAIQKDIDKLKSIKKRAQRWLIVYRVRPTDGKSPPLERLLASNFRGKLKLEAHGGFETNTLNGERGICEYCLAKVL